METTGREQQIIKERKKKIKELREQGINPYPYSFERTTTCKEIKETYQHLQPETNTKETIRTAGRIMNKRKLGKILFIKLQDEEETIQLVAQKEETPQQTFDLIKQYADTGDYLGIEGEIITTKTGELSIKITEATILTKALYPLPDEHYGLKNKEERYRKRHLDLIMNKETKEIFKKRSKIITTIREYLNNKGFTEVETPLLQTQHGGAAAKPFITNINAWDMNMYLSISPELYLKRLIVGGLEKVYTICKNFRNEGVDHSHNPEFTMIEIYEAYKDYNDMMKLMEECWEHVALTVLGTTTVKRNINGKEETINFKAPWPRKTVQEILQEYEGINIEEMSEKQLQEYCKKNSIPTNNDMSWGELVEEILGEQVEKKIIQPTHIIDRPKEGTPLCKRHRNNNKLNEQCEPVAAGMELGNMYSELNDPEQQEEEFNKQTEKKTQGNEEAQETDKEFLDAIKQGMPPTGGIGWGIDRMVILLTEVESIREAILFPTMKPEEQKKKKKQ